MAHPLLLPLGNSRLIVLNSEVVLVTEEHSPAPGTPTVPGVSAAITALQRVIVEIAPTDIPVLILGESGTGKEVIASEIHRLSARCKAPFIKCSCSSFSLDWLLGGKNGIGRGMLPPDGTVLLDEIGQLDTINQNLLLALLPDGNRTVPPHCVTSRIISTSTNDLAEQMRSNSFRQELYFRLNGICLRIPPLRDRREDIPLLLASFLAKYSNLLGRPQPRVQNSTLDLFAEYSWPGNVRELENAARKIVVLGDEELALTDFRTSMPLELPASAPSNRSSTNARSLKQAAREASRKAERQLILESLERTHWNRKRSARELQISYKALLYKLKQLGLDDGVATKPD
jgi:two-component system response regulator AtoC